MIKVWIVSSGADTARTEALPSQRSLLSILLFVEWMNQRRIKNASNLSPLYEVSLWRGEGYMFFFFYCCFWWWVEQWGVNDATTGVIGSVWCTAEDLIRRLFLLDSYCSVNSFLMAIKIVEPHGTKMKEIAQETENNITCILLPHNNNSNVRIRTRKRRNVSSLDIVSSILRKR